MTLRNALIILTNALLAGIMIGIAGTVYLAVPNEIAGALFFAFGLMTILCFGFKLYTGAIGYLMTQQKSDAGRYLLTLFLIWIGNFAGCFLVGSLIRMSRTFGKISARVEQICQVKMADDPASILILAIFCGLLMYLGVESYRRENLPPVFRFAAVFLCVAIFILSGFEHCIANMYYFSAAGVWSGKTLALIALMTLGNSIGSWIVPLGAKVR